MVGGPPVAARRRFDVRLHSQAATSYRRLRGPIVDRINTAIEALAREPGPNGAVKLAGRDDYRIRVGDYRIVYAVDDTQGLILVARIAHRRDVYRH